MSGSRHESDYAEGLSRRLQDVADVLGEDLLVHRSALRAHSGQVGSAGAGAGAGHADIEDGIPVPEGNQSRGELGEAVSQRRLTVMD